MNRARLLKEAFDGYLYSVYESLGGHVQQLQEYCDEVNYLAEVRAALLIVQDIRFDPNEEPRYGPKATRPREVLQPYAKAVDEAIYECDLYEPEVGEVRKVLEEYRMLEERGIARMLKELPNK